MKIFEKSQSQDKSRLKINYFKTVAVKTVKLGLGIEFTEVYAYSYALASC